MDRTIPGANETIETFKVRNRPEIVEPSGATSISEKSFNSSTREEGRNLQYSGSESRGNTAGTLRNRYPPGRKTRCISSTAFCGKGTYSRTCVHKTTSNFPAANGSCSAFPITFREGPATTSSA